MFTQNYLAFLFYISGWPIFTRFVLTWNFLQKINKINIFIIICGQVELKYFFSTLNYQGTYYNHTCLTSFWSSQKIHPVKFIHYLLITCKNIQTNRTVKIKYFINFKQIFTIPSFSPKIISSQNLIMALSFGFSLGTIKSVLITFLLLCFLKRLYPKDSNF